MNDVATPFTRTATTLSPPPVLTSMLPRPLQAWTWRLPSGALRLATISVADAGTLIFASQLTVHFFPFPSEGAAEVRIDSKR